MSDNLKIVVYIIAMTVIVSVVLAFSADALDPVIKTNKENDKKALILKSVMDNAEVESGIDVASVYEERVEAFAINSAGERVEGVDGFKVVIKDENKKPIEDRNLPVFIYTDESGKSTYIIPLYGKGLWDDIWGYVALENDFSTVVGAVFDHKAETPGLGAEITQTWFQDQFEGKELFASNDFVFEVKKGRGHPTDPHYVDGISGATVTTNGVSAMIQKDMGIYQPFFESKKSK